MDTHKKKADNGDINPEMTWIYTEDYISSYHFLNRKCKKNLTHSPIIINNNKKIIQSSQRRQRSSSTKNCKKCHKQQQQLFVAVAAASKVVLI